MKHRTRGSVLMWVVTTVMTMSMAALSLLQYHQSMEGSARRRSAQIQSFYWQDANARLGAYLASERLLNRGSIDGETFTVAVVAQLAQTTFATEISGTDSLPSLKQRIVQGVITPLPSTPTPIPDTFLTQ